MSDDEDERPKKSWREIDAARDRSMQRREKGGGGAPKKSKRSDYESKRYKADLDKIFDGGGLPEHLAEKLVKPEAAASVKARQELIRKVREAEDNESCFAAIAQLYDVEKTLPEVEDVLVPAVEHPHATIAVIAIDLLTVMHAGGLLKRKPVLRLKLAGLADLSEEEEVRAKAKALLAKL
jgi:hypothetical protein